MSRSTFLPAAVIAISALAGCAGGPEQPATAPVAEHDSPGEGRKPASGAWLEHRYGDWSAEHGSATERHFQQGEAFGQTEQLTQPTVRVMVNKDNDADVRSNPLLTSGGMRSRSRSARRGAPPSPSSASASSSSTEAISNSLARMPTAQSSGHSPRTFTRRCRMTRTRLNPRRAPHPTTPVRTANPSKERVGQWEVVGGGSDHQAVYGRPGAARMSDGALVSLQKGDLDARRLASLIKSAEQHEEAWCQTVGSNLQCYVQLDGGVLQVVEGDNQPAGDAPALANALYEAL